MHCILCFLLIITSSTVTVSRANSDELLNVMDGVNLQCLVAGYLSCTNSYCGPCSLVGIATDYGLDGLGSNPGGDEILRLSRPAPGAHPASCKVVTMSFWGVKCGRGMLLTTHPLLVLRSWKSRAIPLPTLWATPCP